MSFLSNLLRNMSSGDHGQRSHGSSGGSGHHGSRNDGRRQTDYEAHAAACSSCRAPLGAARFCPACGAAAA